MGGGRLSVPNYSPFCTLSRVGHIWVTRVGWLVLPPTVNGNGRVGIGGCEYIRHPPPEHRRTEHYNHTHHGSVTGVVLVPWGAGVPEVVGTGVYVPGGYAGGSKGIVNFGYGGVGGWG